MQSARARVDMDGKQGDVLGDASLCNYEKRFIYEGSSRDLVLWLIDRTYTVLEGVGAL